MPKQMVGLRDTRIVQDGHVASVKAGEPRSVPDALIPAAEAAGMVMADDPVLQMIAALVDAPAQKPAPKAEAKRKAAQARDAG